MARLEFPMPSDDWGRVIAVSVFDTDESWRFNMRRAKRYYRAGMHPPNRFTADRFRGTHYAPR